MLSIDKRNSSNPNLFLLLTFGNIKKKNAVPIVMTTFHSRLPPIRQRVPTKIDVNISRILTTALILQSCPLFTQMHNMGHDNISCNTNKNGENDSTEKKAMIRDNKVIEVYDIKNWSLPILSLSENIEV